MSRSRQPGKRAPGPGSSPLPTEVIKPVRPGEIHGLPLRSNPCGEPNHGAHTRHSHLNRSPRNRPSRLSPVSNAADDHAREAEHVPRKRLTCRVTNVLICASAATSRFEAAD
jgi:hypothetical protein